MKLKHIFLVLASMLLVVWVLMLGITAVRGGWLFYIAELLITLSLIYLLYFYQKVLRPLDLIIGGMDLLQEQDFGSRLTHVGQSESDRIVDVFNLMMQQLKNEHLHVREQNHFLDLLIAESPMGVLLLDYDGNIQSGNKAALLFLGYEDQEELVGKSVDQLSSSLAQEMATIEKQQAKTIRLSDSKIYRCSHLTFTDRGFPHPFYLIESLTDEVFKAEKKAYEKVIRMIAHEVNNSVAGITSAMDTVNDTLETLPDTEDLQELMKVCIERCYTMSKFITNFADVVKIPAPVLERQDVGEVVSQYKVFLESISRNKDIRLHLRLSDKPVEVGLDRPLFEHVLLNIVKNAVESIGQDGDIYITLQDNPPLLTIADTGAGISKENEQMIFTPFFSTKPGGQGIGLVFIREVLIQHGFAFSLRTDEDGLTKFRIDLRPKRK